MTFRVGLCGVLFLAWLWYESVASANVITVTRQEPSIAMTYNVGFAEGGLVVVRNGMTGSIGGFRLGSPGWTSEAGHYPRSLVLSDFFPRPALDLRHPGNKGFPDQPGAINQHASLLIPVWLLLLVYLVAWFFILRSREKRRDSWLKDQAAGAEPA